MTSTEKIASLLCVLFCSAAAAFGLEIPAKDVEAVAARATELAAVIPAEPVPLIPSITDREKWEAFASLTGTSNVVKRAEKYLAEPIPELPEDLY